MMADVGDGEGGLPASGTEAQDPPASSADFLYDAFASYSSNPDAALVRDVEAFFESLHENPLIPPDQRRPLRLCVDGSDFVRPRNIIEGSRAEGQLFDLIAYHMNACRYFLLFTGPQSAANPWVARELAWWMQNRDPADILVGVTHGEDPQPGRPALLPPQALQIGLDKKLWFDLRGYSRGRAKVSTPRPYDEERLRVAADLLGVAPSKLIPRWKELRVADLRRRTRIRTALGFAGLGAAGIIAYGSLALRTSSGNEAAARQSVESLRLSGEATRMFDALSLSASALKLRPGPEATAALVTAMTLLPVHDRSVVQEADGHAADVVRFVGNDHFMAVGGYSGILRILDSRTGQQRWQARLATRPMAIAANEAGTLIAVSTQQGLELFTLDGGRLQRRSQVTLGERVGAVALTANGRLVAATATSGRVLTYRIEDLLAGRTAPLGGRSFKDGFGMPLAINGLAVVKDNLVLGGGRGGLACVPLGTSGEIRPQRTHEDRILGLTGVPTTASATFVDASGRLVMIEAATCREIRRVDSSSLPNASGRDALGRIRGGLREERPGHGIAASSDGQAIATGSFDGTARVFAADALSPIAFAPDPARARGVALSANAARLAVATERGTVEVWNLDAPVEVWRVAGIERIAVDPGGRWAALQRDDGHLELRNPDDGRFIVALRRRLLPIAADDGSLLLAREPGSSSAQVWRMTGAPQLGRAAEIRNPDLGDLATVGHIVGTGAAVYTLDGHQGASVRLWSADGRPLASRSLSARGRSIALGGRLVAVASGKQAWLLDGQSLQPFRTLTALGIVEKVQLSPDGAWLLLSISADRRRNVLCSLHAPQRSSWWMKLRTLGRAQAPSLNACRRIPDGMIAASAFSPTAPMLAIAVAQAPNSEHGSLFLLKGDRDWAPLQLDDQGRVQAVAFSPDGRYLAAGGTGRTIGIWQAGSNRLVAAFPLPSPIKALNFLPGSEGRLVSLDGSRAGVARLWDWRSEALIARACARWPRSREKLGLGAAGRTIERSALCGG